MKDEIKNREVLVLNNSSLLQVTYNQISTSEVLVKYLPSNVPYIFLNEYNFGMLSFKNTDENISINYLSSRKETEQVIDYSISNMPKLEYNHLKYI